MLQPADRSLETKRALFWAALVAQCADEAYISRDRVVASLLRSESVVALCSRMNLDFARLVNAVESEGALSFDECEQRVMADLARNGLQLGSPEHRATVQPRPYDPLTKPIIGRIIEQHGHIGVSPLELLQDLISADETLARRLASHGLTAEGIRAASR